MSLLGPGPARYALPPTIGFMRHDFTKPTSPAFTFHSRMSDNSECYMVFTGSYLLTDK